MFQTLLFPFRLVYYIVLTVFRIIGFFFGAGVRAARITAGSATVLGIGVFLGLFLGRKFGGRGLPSRKRNGPVR
ncbi:MAG: hypothetical protein JW699_01290 [Chitinispirillaceae bacterium]|nr:hypothetical protein [Chitinispirillaceae bacterium]